MNYALRLIVFIIIAALQSTHAANSLNTSATNPEKSFGYTLGDVLDQKIALSIEDTVHTLQFLPIEQRVGRWLTRSSVATSEDKKWLIIRYQLINAPPDVRIVSLPALTLIADNEVTIDVPAWFFSIAPLLPATTDVSSQLPVIQADELAYIPASDPIRRTIRILTVVLAAWLTLWLAWWLWRNWREARTLPFAHAYYSIRKLAHSNNAKSNDGWLAIHEAFNQSAGRSIVSSTTHELSRSRTWLKPFESEIQNFYSLSSTRFFAPESQHEPFDLNDFSKRLYLAEKRHTSSLAATSSPSYNLIDSSTHQHTIEKHVHDAYQGDAQSRTIGSNQNKAQRAS